MPILSHTRVSVMEMGRTPLCRAFACTTKLIPLHRDSSQLATRNPLVYFPSLDDFFLGCKLHVIMMNRKIKGGKPIVSAMSVAYVAKS